MNTRRPTDAAGESWRKWGAAPPDRLDPDPLTPEHWDDLWDPIEARFVARPPDEGSDRSNFATGVIYAALAWFAGLLLGLFIAGHVLAAPRSAEQPVIPAASSAVVDRQRTEGPASGNLVARPTSAPSTTLRATATARPTSHVVRGIATWYGAAGMIAAAGPALRLGDWRGRLVTVTAGGRSVRVRLADWCACRVAGQRRIIDLSDDVVRALGLSLAAGLYQVTVSW